MFRGRASSHPEKHSVLVRVNPPADVVSNGPEVPATSTVEGLDALFFALVQDVNSVVDVDVAAKLSSVGRFSAVSSWVVTQVQRDVKL